MRICGLLFSLLMACAPQAPKEGPALWTYPRDDVLTLFHAQSKATHNSYHVQGEIDFLGWNYTMAPLDVQAASQGVRAFELDLQYRADTDTLAVFHIGALDMLTNCATLVDCLRALKSFSDSNPRHLPLLLQMEGKGGVTPESLDAFIARVHADVLSVFPRGQLITPTDVQGTFPTLADAVRTRGWPTLQASRGRILLAWDDTAELRTRYLLQPDPLFFVDSAPTDSFAALAVLNDPVENAARIAAALEAGMLVRTRADTDGVEASMEDTTRLHAALRSGAQFISTDYPVPNGTFDYAVDIPGGTPSRCNPVTTADAGFPCSPSDLEHPSGLQ